MSSALDAATDRAVRRRGRALLLAGAAAAVVLAALLTWVMAGSWAGGAKTDPPPVYLELPEFELIHRDGSRVGSRDLAGEPWVADLIFTRCTVSCPRMTMRMRQLGEGLARAGGARRVSISVDPEYDTPEVLTEYAVAWEATDPDWLFLTGDPQEVLSLARDGFRLGVEPAPEGAAEEILHSTRLILVDGQGGVRGYYDAFQAGELDRLLRELAAVHREAG